jgi:hypothetical protein
VLVSELFAIDGSGVVEETVATFLTTSDAARPASTRTVTRRFGVAPGASAPTEQVTVPAAPPAANEHGAVADTNATPAGRTSVTTVPAAVDGPLFRGWRVNVSVSPATTVTGADFVIETSAVGWVLAAHEAALFVGSGSAVADEAVAVSTASGVPEYPAGTDITTVTVAVPDAGIGPIAHVMVPAAGVPQVPCDAEAEVNPNAPGSASTRLTARAVDGPLFATVTV